MRTIRTSALWIISLLPLGLPAKTMWQPQLAVRVTVAFDERHGFEYWDCESLPLPEYPRQMRRAAVGGDVDFEFTLLKDGSITGVTVRSKFPEFEAPVAQAITRWRFYPVAQNRPGLPTEVRMKGKVRFEVPEDIPVDFPSVGLPPPAPDEPGHDRPWGITYELDEKTGKRRY